jgi:small redox-active disulfide protein 2
MLTVKILGPGCNNCKMVDATARQALASMGMQAEIIKVDNYNEIKQYPILATPGLVINEKLVCAGRIPSVAEVTTWLANALETV